MTRAFPQIVAGLIAGFGSLCLGTIIGWASPLEESILNGHLGYTVTKEHFEWICGAMLLGAATICIPIGFIINLIGRKVTMVLMCFPGVVGWIMIIAGKNLLCTCIGRYLIGIAGGSFCMTVPFYTTEIAEVDKRGTLGTFYQLMTTSGILLAFIIAAFCSVFATSIFCSFLFGILFCLLMLIPESPLYYVSKKRTYDAQNTMAWLRGKNFDASNELSDMVNADKEARQNKVNLCKKMCNDETLKGMFLCILAAIVQQFGGINFIVFYGTSMFRKSDSIMTPIFITLTVGTLMWVTTLVTTLIIERAGRRLLTILSCAMMTVSCAIIGFFFFLKDKGENISLFLWLPVVAVYVYIIGFSLGMGPIPWLILGEIFRDDIKCFAGSIVATINWLCAFVVVVYFPQLSLIIGVGPTFWIFAIFNAIGIAYGALMIPETKKRTKDDIQKTLAL